MPSFLTLIRRLKGGLFIILLLIFILGIVFYEILLPVVESYCTTLQTKQQAKQADHALHIAEVNAKVAKLTTEEDETENTRVIGFHTSPISQEEDDYDDDDDL